MLNFKPEKANLDEFYFSEGLQQPLAQWNRRRLTPQFPTDTWVDTLQNDLQMQILEGEFLEYLRSLVQDFMRDLPTVPEAFVAWFENLEKVGPGQHDPLFDWLEESASADEIRWFFEQEAAGEAGFEDLVAMTQVKLPEQAKLEMARNYWDEMGCGNAKGMHGPMLHVVADALHVNPQIDATIPESLALANAMTGLATSRRYAWHSIGALGVIELTALGRSAKVAKGLRRIGLSNRERRYFDLHAVLDIKHSETWNREVLLPLVQEDYRRAVAIAEGALMRLYCGSRCFETYRARLWQ